MGGSPLTSDPNRIRSPENAVPPADNSTGLCVALSLSSFQRTDARTASAIRLSRTIWPLSQPSLGEPSKVTTEDLLCQPRGGKKIAPLGIRSNNPAYRQEPPTDYSLLSIYAPGVGTVPLPASRRQRILAEQVLPSVGPRARYLTPRTAVYVLPIRRRSAQRASLIIRYRHRTVKCGRIRPESSQSGAPAAPSAGR